MHSWYKQKKKKIQTNITKDPSDIVLYQHARFWSLVDTLQIDTQLQMS